VAVDGKVVGHVRNDGTGGANFYEPRELQRTLDAFAASQPPVMHAGRPLTASADLAVGQLLDAWLVRRDFDRAIGKRALIARGETILQTKAMAPAALAQAVQTIAAANDGGRVLNLMPRDEAFALYSQLTARA